MHIIKYQPFIQKEVTFAMAKKNKFHSKKKIHYAISGYRWAPESFHAYKGFTRDSMEEVSLSDEERKEVGMLFLTKGPDVAEGYVRHLERTRERNRRSIMTYGFYTKEPGQFVYSSQLYFCSDASIDERLCIFKIIRKSLAKTDGRIVTFTACEFDGNYKPVNVRENAVTADFSRPLCVPLGSEIIRNSQDPPYCPWTPPKKI